MLWRFTKREGAYDGLVNQISETYANGQRQAAIAVNSHLVETYWKVGQYIVEFEQKGESRAEFGAKLLPNLARDLSMS